MLITPVLREIVKRRVKVQMTTPKGIHFVGGFQVMAPWPKDFREIWET